MIPDRCGTVPPHALGNGSGEVAADRVLHVQRLTLPLRLNTAAQARLGRRPRPTPPPGLNPPARPRLGPPPPPATVLAGEHHPPPRLDDVAERPQIMS